MTSKDGGGEVGGVRVEDGDGGLGGQVRRLHLRCLPLVPPAPGTCSLGRCKSLAIKTQLFPCTWFQVQLCVGTTA